MFNRKRRRLQQYTNPQSLNVLTSQKRSQKQSAIQHYKRNRYVHIALFCVAVIALAILGIGQADKEHVAKVRTAELNSRLIKLQTTQTQLVRKRTIPKYVITSQGHMDYAAANTIQKIKKLFQTCNNWKSGHQYALDRDKAMKYVKDRSFFKGQSFMRPRIDSSGDSEIDNMQIKRMNNGTSVYELSPGKFLVITSFYDYFKQEEMTQKGAMTPREKAFIFYGHQQSIDKVEPLPKLDNND